MSADSNAAVRPVVVGYNGSAAATQPLHWAVREARRLAAPLRVAVVWTFPYFGDVPVGIATDAAAGIESARELLATVLGDVRRLWPDGVVEGVVVEGAPGPALTDLSEEAQLVVVGARGSGGFTRLLLGSVSDHVLRHAHCPVAIIRPGAGAGADETVTGGAVVVGIDGSAASSEALRWGAAAARAENRALVLVAAWHYPVLTGPDGMAGPIPWFDVEGEANDLLTTVRNEHADALRGLDVDSRVQKGSAAAVLLQAAEGATALVIGDHQRKGVGRLLGSVASQCAHHATCPLVVMRVSSSPAADPHK